MLNAKKIGERIALMRKERSLTGERFAELLEVSPQAVSKWETGKNLPETVLLPAISKVLGISIDSILITETYPVKHHLGGHYIDGLPKLKWGQSNDCTWAGSIKLLLDTINVNVTYPEIMGYSGACYYFSMTEDWCPSAAMPQVAYDPAVSLEKAVGIERGFFDQNELDSKVKEVISLGKPVMMIEPRVEMEWGVLCGYTGDGKFYGRSYFDYLKPEENDIFTNNEYYRADKYPGVNPNMICYIRYNVYRSDLAYPGANKEWKPYIIDPELYKDGNIALPSIHDLILFTGMYQYFDSEMINKVETTVQWLFGDGYSNINRRLYYYSPDDPNYKSKAINSKVWIPNMQNISKTDASSLQPLLYLCFILSHFKASREWVLKAVLFFEQYKTEANHYIFPKEMIAEKKDCYVIDDGHMNIGESKKNKKYAEIISNYWMERITANLSTSFVC